MNNIFTINSRKFDGRIHRSWKAELLEFDNGLLKFVGVFENEVVHDILGVIRPGTISYEFYWLDRWYNIFQFHEPDGGLRNFYCNISQPPTFENNILDYVDFDIDILVDKDFSYRVLDVEEYEENRKLFGYPAKVVSEVENSVNEIKNLIKQKEFPFDFQED